MDAKILIGQEQRELTAQDLTEMLADVDMKVTGFWTHTKATEAYAIISVCDDGVWKEWYIPFIYRWHNTFINTAKGLADHIKSCKPLLTAARVEAFKDAMKKRIKHLFTAKAVVTFPIFRKLLKGCGQWICNTDLSKSSNTQRRIQDLKVRGFTLATKVEDKTYHMLLPFDIVKAPTYETFSAKIRKAIFTALHNQDAYNDKTVDRSALPDHKFPEIRWTAGTAESNEGLSEDEMRKKFQLVPESVNQAKREVCRGCFLSGKRGKFSGIDFFYDGDGRWPSEVPMVGKEAEAGCVGCFWYDMAAWRKALNNLIRGRKE